MPTMENYRLSEQLRILIYGKSKAGKTAGAGTFPRPNFIDMDQGIGTLVNPWWLDTYGYRPSVMYEQFPERAKRIKGVPSAHNSFDDACRYFDACMNPKGAKWTSPSTGAVHEVHPDMFDTWILDSGTTLSQAASLKGVILLGSKDMGGKPLSQTFASAQATGLILPRQQDFGAERSMVEQFIDMLYGSGKHFVLICHEKEVYNEAGNLERIVPLLTGQSTERVPLKFDEVYNLRVQKAGTELNRYLQTKDDGIRLAGTRALGLPDKTPWNWDAINKAITNQRVKITSATPTIQQDT